MSSARSTFPVEAGFAGFGFASLLLAASDFWERFFAGYHTGGVMLEIWLGLAVAVSVTGLCISWFASPRRRPLITTNVCLLVSATSMFAAYELKQRDRRSDKVGVQKLLDEERTLKQMPAQP